MKKIQFAKVTKKTAQEVAGLFFGHNKAQFCDGDYKYIFTCGKIELDVFTKYDVNERRGAYGVFGVYDDGYKILGEVECVDGALVTRPYFLKDHDKLLSLIGDLKTALDKAN